MLEDAKEIEKELTRIFDRFNHHFWNDELPSVIITFKPTKGAYGHMSTTRCWVSDDLENKYELNISAFTIDRTPEEICATLLHEQVHLYCIINNISDCSNIGRYHNKRFKKIAEEHGLECKLVDNYGWAKTTLSDEGFTYFKKLNIKKSSYNYVKPPRKVPLKRYRCPRCQITTAWLSSKQYILCGYCKVRLVYTPVQKDKHTKQL